MLMKIAYLSKVKSLEFLQALICDAVRVTIGLHIVPEQHFGLSECNFLVVIKLVPLSCTGPASTTILQSARTQKTKT
jgi:hypothetical protein